MSLPRTVLLAALIVAAAYGSTLAWRAAQRPESRLETVACWFAKPASRAVECYRLTVPESRGTASNRSVELPVVILRSPSTPVGEPPVLHLGGGPGQPAGIEDTAQVAGWSQRLDSEPWARDRDHILVDTRGNGGRAGTRLRCDRLSDLDWMMSVDALADEDLKAAAIRKAVGDCHAGFARQGVDLTAYDSAAAASDLIDLRKALNLKSWTVYGLSYGSRLALELMRRDAAGTHAAILDSIYPPSEENLVDLLPNLQHALNLLYADCAAQQACAGAYPELSKDVEAAVTRLRAQPRTLVLAEPGGRRPATVKLDDALYLQLVEYAMFSGEWLPFVPGIVNDAAKGGTALLGHLAQRLVFDGSLATDSNAVLLSTFCREELPFNSETAFEKASRANPLLRAISPATAMRVQCGAWPAGKAPPAFRTAVTSDVPTLLINGAYDTRTPPAFAERAAAHLTYAYRIVLRNRGHAPSPASPCAKAAIDAFLDAPINPAPPACLQEQKPPRFMTRGGPAEHVEQL